MRIDSAIITGSFSVNGDTFNDLGSYSTTGSNTFVGNQSIVGAVSASAFTGSISYTHLTNVPTLVSGSEQIVSILSPLNSFTSSATARLNSIETISASNIARLNALETTSASVDTLNTTQNVRLTLLEEKTGSLATTGSNTFYGTQVFTGSVYITQNLVVQGSSSLQNITASAVDIGTNKIILNVNNPSVRYAGISVYDSGSTAGTGSLFWDSVYNHWLYEHPSDSAAPYNSAILISGPKNAGNLGEELELVNNYIVKAVGGDHISSSAIYDDGNTIKLLSNTEVTSSLKVSGSISIGTSETTGSLTIQSKFGSGQSGSLLNIKTSYTNKNSIIELAELSSDGAIILKHALATSPTVLITSQTGGASPSYFNNGSNVGIGRTNPEFTLDVNGDIALTRTNKLMFAGPTAGDRSRSYITGDGNNNLYIYGPSSNILATFGYTGDVGIGITNPGQKLEVASGSIKISNTGYGLILPGSIHTSAQINFYNANTAIELMKLPVANNTFTFYANTDKLYYYSDKGSVGNFFTLTTDGNIGIGTTIPAIHGNAGYKTLTIVGGASNRGWLELGTSTASTNGNIFGQISGFNGTNARAGEVRFFDGGATNSAGVELAVLNSGTVTPVLRITSTGNVGIGTLSPTATLHTEINSSTWTSKIINTNTSTNNAGLLVKAGVNSGNEIILAQKANGTNVFLVDASGNVGIGTNNPLAKLEVKASGDGDLFIARYSGGAAKLIYGYQSSADGFLELRTGADSTVTKLSGYTGTASYFLSDVGVGITNPNGNRLYVFGTLCVQNNSGYGLVKGYDDAYHGMIMRGYPTTATNLTDITATDVMSFYEYGGDYRFFTKNPSSLTMHVRFNLGTIYATNTTVQSVSDIRTKENIRNSDEGLNIISALRPVRFDFKNGHNDSKKNQLGFIAQEVEEVFPDAVSEWEKEPGQIYKTMGPSALIPVLVKAVQELKAEIEVLKNK